MSAVCIERIGPDGWRRYRSIRLAALADTPDAFGTTLAEAAARAEDNWRSHPTDVPTWVAVGNGEDVGLVRCAADDTQPATDAWLISMWVSPGARGAGVGDALVATVAAFAIESGYRRLHLDVADGNTHAVALYARHGFVASGRRGHLPPPREHVTEHHRCLELPCPS